MCLGGQQKQRREAACKAQGGRVWLAECVGVHVQGSRDRMEDTWTSNLVINRGHYSMKNQSANFPCKALCFTLYIFAFTFTFKPEILDGSLAPEKF